MAHLTHPPILFHHRSFCESAKFHKNYKFKSHFSNFYSYFLTIPHGTFAQRDNWQVLSSIHPHDTNFRLTYPCCAHKVMLSRFDGGNKIESITFFQQWNLFPSHLLHHEMAFWLMGKNRQFFFLPSHANVILWFWNSSPVMKNGWRCQISYSYTLGICQVSNFQQYCWIVNSSSLRISFYKRSQMQTKEGKINETRHGIVLFLFRSSQSSYMAFLFSVKYTDKRWEIFFMLGYSKSCTRRDKSLW